MHSHLKKSFNLILKPLNCCFCNFEAKVFNLSLIHRLFLGWFNFPPELPRQVQWKQVEPPTDVFICLKNDPKRLEKMDISALATRTQTITAITSPQATCTHSNWSLLPSVVHHHRGLWKLPHSRLHNYPESPRQRSRTARHNRAAQAEVTTPYPAPRFSTAATVAQSRVNSGGDTGENGLNSSPRRSRAEKIRSKPRCLRVKAHPARNRRRA